MSCYFRYMKDVFEETHIKVTTSNKRSLDQAIHAFVGVAYKRCMPDCWSKVKPAVQDKTRRQALIKAIKQVR